MTQPFDSVSERPSLTDRLDAFLFEHDETIHAVLYVVFVLALFVGALLARDNINVVLGVDIPLSATIGTVLTVWPVTTIMQVRAITTDKLYDGHYSPLAEGTIGLLMYDATAHAYGRKSRLSRVARRIIGRSDTHRMWVSVLRSERAFLRSGE